jgi:CelD/BcsL family acetyltransferase involved in cellulose biosynthesis
VTVRTAVEARTDAAVTRHLTVSEVRDVATFEALEKSWDACAAQDPEGGFFSSHAWFSCCVDAFGAGKQLRIVVLSDRGRVIAIAPLWQQVQVRRGVRVGTISFIDGPETQRTDFIVASDDRNHAIRAFLDFLLAPAAAGWDVLDLTRWPETSPNIVPLRRELATRGIPYAESTSALVPFIPTTGSWEAFLQSKSPKFRKTHRNVANRLERLANVRVVRLSQPSDVPLFAKLRAVSLKSWKQDEGISMSAETTRGRFFERVTAAAAKENAWLGWILEADGRPIAMEYDLVSDGVVYAIRSDFDAGYNAYSPGVYLEHQVIKAVFELGYREYNAGPGLAAYKLRWTDQARRNLAVTVYNRTLKGFALGGLEKMVVPAARRMAGITRSPWLRRRSPTVAS